MTKDEFREEIFAGLSRDYQWFVLCVEMDIRKAIKSTRYVLMPRTQVISLCGDYATICNEGMKYNEDRIIGLEGFYKLGDATEYILDLEDYKG